MTGGNCRSSLDEFPLRHWDVRCVRRVHFLASRQPSGLTYFIFATLLPPLLPPLVLIDVSDEKL